LSLLTSAQASSLKPNAMFSLILSQPPGTAIAKTIAGHHSIR
jgi:hypothetical protein